MIKRMITAVILFLFASCDKDDEVTGRKKTATELLTQKDWIINAAGFDDNKNGLLDAEENTLQPCQADNSYVFAISGSGSIADNALSCGTPVNTNFQWSFQEEETKLKIDVQSNLIQRLTEHEMILVPELPGLNVNFILVYRH